MEYDKCEMQTARVKNGTLTVYFMHNDVRENDEECLEADCSHWVWNRDVRKHIFKLTEDIFKKRDRNFSNSNNTYTFKFNNGEFFMKVETEGLELLQTDVRQHRSKIRTYINGKIQEYDKKNRVLRGKTPKSQGKETLPSSPIEKPATPPALPLTSETCLESDKYLSDKASAPTRQLSTVNILPTTGASTTAADCPNLTPSTRTEEFANLHTSSQMIVKDSTLIPSTTTEHSTSITLPSSMESRTFPVPPSTANDNRILSIQSIDSSSSLSATAPTEQHLIVIVLRQTVKTTTVGVETNLASSSSTVTDLNLISSPSTVADPDLKPLHSTTEESTLTLPLSTAEDSTLTPQLNSVSSLVCGQAYDCSSTTTHRTAYDSCSTSSQRRASDCSCSTATGSERLEKEALEVRRMGSLQRLKQDFFRNCFTFPWRQLLILFFIFKILKYFRK